MSELGDVFGSDFEEKYNQKEQMRQEKRRKVGKETLMEACWVAVHGEGFDGEEPRFTFGDEDVEYDVLLMQAPDNNMDKFIHGFGDDGKTLGMFHLGELFSCAFLGDMKQLIGKVEEGEHYIVIGTYQENESNGQTYFNVNPVAGIAPISQAKTYADKMDDKMSGSSIEEQTEEQKGSGDDTDEDSSDDDDMDLALDDEDDEQASEEDVYEVFKAVRDKKKELIKEVAGGDEDALETLTGIVAKNADGEASTDYVADIFEDKVGDIDGRGEDEVEDGEDDMDLGLDEDTEDDNEDEVEEDETIEDESEDDSDDGEGVEDWF